MTLTFTRREWGLGTLIPVSLLFHIAFYAFCWWLHFFPTIHLPDAPVYYVDVVSLPVASPQAGTPGPPAQSAKEATPPKPRPQASEMKLPAPRSAARPQPSAKPPVSGAKESEQAAREFEERLSRIEKANEARHEAAALAALRSRAAGGTKPVGMPGGTGKEAGSDYASYIRSRLVDAFKTTIAYQSKDPRVIVTLYIDRTGRVTRSRVERSSGDRLFEESVKRAIAKAEKEFRPPPGGGVFEYGFIFSPQGVGKQ